MAEDRIAIVSDVHGNLTAYRAVLDDITRRGIDDVINLGDVIGKGPLGSACVAATQERCRLTVRGNWDAGVVNAHVDQLNPAQLWWLNDLTDADRDWLANLPGTHDLLVSGRRVRLFHASSTDEFTRVMFHHSDDQFNDMFAATPSPVTVRHRRLLATATSTTPTKKYVGAGSCSTPVASATLSMSRQPVTWCCRARSAHQNPVHSRSSSCGCRTTSRPRLPSPPSAVCPPWTSTRESFGPVSIAGSRPSTM